MTSEAQSDWLVELSHMQSHVGQYILQVELSCINMDLMPHNLLRNLFLKFALGSIALILRVKSAYFNDSA